MSSASSSNVGSHDIGGVGGKSFDIRHDLFRFVIAAVDHQPAWALRDPLPEEDHYQSQDSANPEGAPRQALSCKLMVEPGMEVVEVATEIKYCLRELGLK